MILYIILDRDTREPVRTRNNITYRVYNSYRDASIALSTLADGLITPEKRAQLEGDYAIAAFDSNRIPFGGEVGPTQMPLAIEHEPV